MGVVRGVTLRGVDAVPVEVEVEITGGLFVISVVGLPDAAVREARERVRAALRSSGIPLRGRVAVNLDTMTYQERRDALVAARNNAYDLIIDGESYRSRLKPNIDKDGPPPAAPVVKHLPLPRRKKRPRG